MKKKDHLYSVQDLAKSVLRGATAVAVCGVEKVFTREDFDDTKYYLGCKECMTGAAAETPDVISIHKKRAWVEVLETAFLSLLDDRSRPVRWSWQSTGTSNATFGATLPPAA